MSVLDRVTTCGDSDCGVVDHYLVTEADADCSVSSPAKPTDTQ